MGTSGHKKGVPDTLPTTGRMVGKGGAPLAKDNASFASGVAGGVQAEAHPSRSRMGAGESAGARLTVSPSWKIPQESPVPTQGGGRPVPSTPSRQGSFGAGQGDASFG